MTDKFVKVTWAVQRNVLIYRKLLSKIKQTWCHSKPYSCGWHLGRTAPRKDRLSLQMKSLGDFTNWQVCEWVKATLHKTWAIIRDGETPCIFSGCSDYPAGPQQHPPQNKLTSENEDLTLFTRGNNIAPIPATHTWGEDSQTNITPWWWWFSH